MRHEAEVLRHLACPWVAPLLAVGREGPALYLVTPLVPGLTLAERLAAGGPLPVADALAVGRGLMRALQAVHEHGVLHRDVKPGNVIIGPGAPPERVTLIDFGLARSGMLDASVRDLPVGTVAYVSPEQAGLIHTEVGERSDLYSAGILLFECLAGRPPFVAATIGELLRQHLTLPPPSLRPLGHAVPRALDDVVHRLLEKDPRDRYQSAAAVLADLEVIAAGLERGVGEPVVAVGAYDRRHTLTEPAFVGRERELGAFEEALARAAAGASALLLVDGESGSGKTRMLDEAALRARQHGAWVLRGQGAAGEAQRPLQALEPVAAAIVEVAERDPSLARRLRARLGEHLETVAAALPQLGALLTPGTRSLLGPEAHGEARTLAALVALLDALGTRASPAAILLDDCQWLDELTLKLLVRWQQARAAAPSRGGVLLVAAYRGEEVGPDSPLRRLEPASRIALGPLGAAEVRRMAESMAGELPAAAVELVLRLSEGNPFLAAAVLEGLVEGGALVGTARGWELEPHAMAQAQSSRRAAAFLARRLDTLSPPVLRLLSVGAVLGKSFELGLAAELAGQSAIEAMDAVAEARRRHLVFVDAPRSRGAFVHDRLRDAVLERLSPAARRDLHRLAADTLARTAPAGPERAFELAYHLDAADDHARALPHALAAASQARAQYALEVAERYYRIAARGAADERVPVATRRGVAEGLGEVLLMRGHYEEARACLEQARALAESAVAQARIEGAIGELAFKRGDAPTAAGALERALRLLGRRVPRGLVAVAAATLLQVLVQVAHTLLPRRLIARRRLEDGEADLLAAHLFSRLAYAYWFVRGQVATFWAHLNELNLAERYPPTRELAQACSEHSISVTGLPHWLFGRGVRYAERGLAIRRARGDVWGQGQSLNFYGMLLYAFGHYAEALAKFREALRLLRRTGDRWEENLAAVHVAFCHYRLGALPAAVAECRRVHREALEIGDGHAQAVVLEVWAKASGGAVPAEHVAAALQSSTGDAQAHESVLQAEGVRLIGAGRPAAAAAALAAAAAAARGVNLKSEYVSYLPIWVALARRLGAVQGAGETGVLPPARVRAAAAPLRRGLRLARRYRGNLPLALRERAHLRAMRGQARAARRDLDASLAEAERQGARFEAAQTLLARGVLGEVFGWPGAAAEAARARGLLHELGADFACSPLLILGPEEGRPKASLSLADRFASIVDQGRRVASALTPADVHTAVCEAAAVLLRGETTLVLAAAEARMLAHRGGAVELSRALLECSRRASRPVVLTEVPHGSPAESLTLAGLRSALCAPILVGGRPAACLYVTHARVGDLFWDEEQQLAGYLATLAGASLEKAEAFAAVQAFTRTLEQRVAERTSELQQANAELDANLRRLREAQDELVQAARMAAVGTLVAGLSHELNNPLAVILTAAQNQLRRLGPDDPMRPAFDAIARQARRSAELVGSLLDFSRKRSDDREEVTLEALVQRVVTLESLKVRRHHVRLELQLPPPGACRVYVARAPIESALINLIDNAADASPQGAVVQIEAAPRERASRPGVEVCVRDHGAGIEPALLARIFDPFFTTKPVGQGTGLGLPLARRFVEGQEGQLSIESAPGQGTTARLWLPVSERAAP
ncbi:MAG TPA: BREX system ATP-binding domain-containing protein [Polyangia bacterium]